LDPHNAAAEWVVVPHRIPKDATSPADIPGPFTMWVHPQFDPSECILHVTLGDGKVYTFQFYTPLAIGKDKEAEQTADQAKKTKEPPPRPVAYARVRFRSPPPPQPAEADPVTPAGGPSVRQGGQSGASAKVVHSEDPPEADLQLLSPEAECGLLDFVRLLQSLPADRAVATAKANPVVQTVMRGSAAEDVGVFGRTHAVRLQWVCRDSTSGAMAFGVEIENRTPFSLTFSVSSWAVRVGHGAIYRATSARGARFVAPGATEYAQFVVSRDANGDPLRLDPGRNTFTPSVELLSTKSARPFQSRDVPTP